MRRINNTPRPRRQTPQQDYAKYHARAEVLERAFEAIKDPISDDPAHLAAVEFITRQFDRDALSWRAKARARLRNREKAPWNVE